MSSSRRKPTIHDYVYDSTEQTATCCLGDVFFRKRRLTAANSDFYVKPKLPSDDDDVNNDDTSGRLASSTERTLATTGAGVNLNSKYQASSDDNSRGTRLAATPDNDSYGRGPAAVNPPGGGRPSSLHDSADLPPRYTPTRDAAEQQPLQVRGDGDGAPGSSARGRSRQRPRAVSAGRVAKEHELLQNMWLENHGRRQADQRVRRSSSMGASSRTVYVFDRATGTTYRRGRLLGKVFRRRRRDLLRAGNGSLRVTHDPSDPLSS